MLTLSESFFVLTGGPGSGKTSLIEALARAGHAHMPEAGRSIIQDQVLIGGDALPWRNPAAYAELMLSWEMRSYRQALDLAGPVFFDRGIPDIVGYLRTIDSPVPAPLKRAADLFRYSSRVLIFPPWAEIFAQDDERKQSFDEAVRTYEAMVETYTICGYSLIEVPCLPVQDRVDFVLDALSLNEHG
jgi:predicted ATPase